MPIQTRGFTSGTGGGRPTIKQDTEDVVAQKITPPPIQNQRVVGTNPADDRIAAAMGTPGPASGSNIYGPRESDPFTGFASRYTSMGAGQIWRDPTIVFQDLMQGRGTPLQPGSGFMEGAEQIGALLPYFNMLMSNAPTEYGDEAFINMAAELYRQMTTRGGRAPDVGFLLDQILNPQGLMATSLYGTADAPMDVDDQISALNDYMTAALYGVNPLAQRSVVDAVRGAGRGYRGALARGDQQVGSSNFLDYVRQQGILDPLQTR